MAMAPTNKKRRCSRHQQRRDDADTRSHIGRVAAAEPKVSVSSR